VSPAHYVEAFDQIAEVGMRTREIREYDLSPTVPVRFQQPRAGGPRILVAEWVVIGEYSRASVNAALMSGYDIAQRWAFI
jgi:hypothetical protein